MRISWKMVLAIAILAGSGTWGPCVMAQSHPGAAELVQKLQSDKISDNARKQLLQLGSSDPDVRRYLAAQLPPLIERGPKSCPPSEIVDLNARWHSCPWYNAVELAGNLKIGEASSALGPWINWRNGGPLLTAIEAQLLFYPAAKALAEIGDPAIPVLQRVLNSGNAGEHTTALRVLCIIHTTKAMAVLQDAWPHESDPEVQTTIKSCLRK